MTTVPIKWKIVNISPKIKNAKTAVNIGIGDTITEAFETSIYDRLLYQNNRSIA
jgi:hypothetical protein